MNTTHNYSPARFFALTFLVTWLCWIPAAALSRSGAGEAVLGGLMGLGLLGPLAGSLLMLAMAGDRGLWRDFASRLLDPRRIRAGWLPVLVFLMPVVMVAAILVSTVAGGSMEQLALTAEFNIMEGSPLLSLVIPVLAPALEEMGWGGYGIDSLRSKCGLFRTSLIFGALWGVWHLPLFFIQGYYHHSLVEANILYAVNFFVSVLPLTFITNWLYYRNGRSIAGAIIFHVSTVVSAEMFLVTNGTKCIVTLVLAVLTVLLVWADRREFFPAANCAEENSLRVCC
jgi:membrane protease YdiL (CAAX protease family)